MGSQSDIENMVDEGPGFNALYLTASSVPTLILTDHVLLSDKTIDSTGTIPNGGGVQNSNTNRGKIKFKKKKYNINNSRHKCEECLRTFTSSCKLIQHKYSHSGEKPFSCKECKKSFSSRFKLVRHELTHTDNRQYKCHACDRSFHRKDHLKNHLKVHNPEKKTYFCEKPGCTKAYNSQLNFRKHMANHSAEDGDLECKVCWKMFDTKDALMFHLKVHAGSRTVKSASEKKHKCEFCDLHFFTNKDVKRHVVVHTKNRDFLCQYCPQRFGRKDHLVRHIKNFHHRGNIQPKSPGTDKTISPEPPRNVPSSPEIDTDMDIRMSDVKIEEEMLLPIEALTELFLSHNTTSQSDFFFANSPESDYSLAASDDITTTCDPLLSSALRDNTTDPSLLSLLEASVNNNCSPPVNVPSTINMMTPLPKFSQAFPQ